MSRIELTPLDPESHPDRQVYVGWDPAQRTYFAQVFDGVDADGEEVILLDVGGDFGEIGDPQQVVDAVASYAQIPDSLAVDLVNEPPHPMLSAQTSEPGTEIGGDNSEITGGTREQAMRSAFATLQILRVAMTDAGSEAEILRLQAQADAVAAPWQNGPEATQWQWLLDVAEDWRTSPRTMRRITDNTRHDLQIGHARLTSFQYRSLDQAGKLIDPLYRDQTAWRAEHLQLAAEQGRLDAQLHYDTATPEAAAAVAAGKNTAREAVWGDHAEDWSPERREWEATYSMDGANRTRERQTYFAAYAAEQTRLTHPQPDTSAEATSHIERDGARIGRLLAAAASGAEPAPAPPIQPDQQTATAVVLGPQPSEPGPGHELG